MGLSASEVLAENLRKLIDRVGSQVALAEATQVPQKTISRAINAENAANLDTLNDLAQGLGLEPWQLLAPDFDPGAVETLPVTSQSHLPMSPEAFGELIRQKRLERKLTQSQVASSIHVTKGAVSHWEQGRVEGIDPLNLLALSSLLGLEATDVTKKLMQLGVEPPTVPAHDLELLRQIHSLPPEVEMQIRALVATLAKATGK